MKDYLNPEHALIKDKDGKETGRDVHVAVVALLSLMAHMDGIFMKEEFKEVIRSTVSEFNLMDDQAAELREIAEFLLRDQSQVDKFIDTINVNFDVSQKEKVLEMMWRVALADGHIDKDEKALYEVLRKRLSLE